MGYYYKLPSYGECTTSYYPTTTSTWGGNSNTNYYDNVNYGSPDYGWGQQCYTKTYLSNECGTYYFKKLGMSPSFFHDSPFSWSSGSTSSPFSWSSGSSSFSSSWSSGSTFSWSDGPSSSWSDGFMSPFPSNDFYPSHPSFSYPSDLGVFHPDYIVPDTYYGNSIWNNNASLNSNTTYYPPSVCPIRSNECPPYYGGNGGGGGECTTYYDNGCGTFNCW